MYVCLIKVTIAQRLACFRVTMILLLVPFVF